MKFNTYSLLIIGITKAAVTLRNEGDDCTGAEGLCDWSKSLECLQTVKVEKLADPNKGVVSGVTAVCAAKAGCDAIAKDATVTFAGTATGTYHDAAAYKVTLESDTSTCTEGGTVDTLCDEDADCNSGDELKCLKIYNDMTPETSSC